MKRSIPVSAIHRYKKSRTGIASARAAKLKTNHNILCIQFIPKPKVMQRLKSLLWRWTL